MSERTAPFRRRMAATVAACALVATGVVATAVPAAAAEPDVTLAPNPAYAGTAFKGWGTSLVWMANATGDYPAELRDQLIDMVFGDEGLNLNIARYNIGGGNATDVPDYLRPGGAVPGWWNPDAPLADAQGAITSNHADRDRFRAAWTGDNASDYDFSADAAQLAWVDAIKDDVDTWEAFSNSPPYFMTQSGFVSGGTDAWADQIRTDSLDEFAKYLKTVVQHVEDTHGIEFDSIDPLNEPNTGYWKTTLGGNGWPTSASRQEGAQASPGLQSQVIAALDAELAKPGTTTAAKISSPDETHPSRFLEDWNGWSAATKGIVDQLNVHTYATGNRHLVRDLAKSIGKPLWMSEVEGNWGGDWWNPNSIDNGLGVADLVNDDLRELESEAWVLWQPVEDLYNMEKVEKKNWGSVFIDFDCDADGNSVRRIADGAADPSCGIQVNSKYNTLRNFTHYIKPGDHLVRVDDNDTTAAIDGDGSGATLVYTNHGGSARTVEIDLSMFGEVGAGATVTPIVTTESPDSDRTANALVAGAPVAVSAATKTATLSVPARSVTTFVVSDVSGVAASAPALRDGESYTITGVPSGKLLTAGSTSAQLGVAGDPSKAPQQTWTATLVADETGTSRDRFVLRLADGRALASNGGSTSFKTVTDEQAAGDTTVQWMLTSTDGTEFTLLNASRQQVLDVAGGSTSTGANVGLWESNWGANQLWSLTEQPDEAAFPETDLAALTANDFVLYFANSGAGATGQVAPGDHMGLYQTRTDQPYGVESKTAARWGYMSGATSNPTREGSTSSLDKTQTILYDAEPSGANLSNREVVYGFDIPDGTYDVTFGIKLFSGWGDRTVELRTEGAVREAVATSTTLVERTYEVEVSDGRLDASVHSRNGRTGASTDPAVNYIVVRAQNAWTIDVLQALLDETDVDSAEYTELSVPAWQEARADAQQLVDDESTDATAIEQAYTALRDAFDALVAKIAPYTSFRPGQEWLDTGGKVIQAHGGQVVPSTDDEGRTIYYLYGEDRTNGYWSSPGVHVYSSYDLYNWEDRGVALRAMDAKGQFDTDPYFQELYGDYTTAQKDAVYRDLGTVQIDPAVRPPIIERPKVIYNESTGKWVMWAHMDGPSETSDHQYAKAKAGVAISDSPFGPFRYIDSYYLNSSPEGWGTPGMARDMNLFVDDDGTGYIIYSSEDNATTFISKLDDEYTYLATPPDEAVAGVDYNRITVDQDRESPAIFKHDERYFIISSWTTGWSPNPARWATATDIMGDWTIVGDPFPWWAQHNSWNSQPSSVIPLDPENGKYIYMGDRWNGGSDDALRNAPMVWLPINMGEGGDSLSVEVRDEWTLEDLDQWAVWDVTGVPESVALGDEFDVPTVTVTQNGEASVQPVTWTTTAGSFDTAGIVTVTGTLPEFGGRTFTRTIAVVPDGLRYAVNAGGPRTADWNAFADAAAEASPLLNSLPDQAHGADAGTAKTWGYVSPGSKTSATAGEDMFSTLRYAVGGNDLEYRFGGLEAGTYTVYAGYSDPWAQWDDRGARVTINGTVVENDHDYGAANESETYGNITVGADGKLTFTLSKSRAPDVQLSWLLVALDEAAAPALDVSVVASTRCVAKKVVVTVQATNNEATPVALTFTSAYGSKAFPTVAAGKNAAHAFTTRAGSISGGSVTMQAQATRGGAPVSATVEAPYAGASCE